MSPDRKFETPRVEPDYRLEFLGLFDTRETNQSTAGLSSEVMRHTIPFIDSNKGKPRVALIESTDKRFIGDVASIGSLGNLPVSEETVQNLINRFSTRLPIARTSLSEDKGVDCEEPSCRFHFEGGCVNPEVMIQDDCYEDSYCLTYETERK